MTIRVALVDDHGIVREGIRQVLMSEPDMTVVGEAGNGPDALALVEQLAPDVLLLDITMPGMTGLEVVRALRERGATVRVLMLSVHDDTGYVMESLRSGAQGYVRKDTTPAELRTAIRALHAGEGFLGPAIAKRVAMALHGEPAPAPAPEPTSVSRGAPGSAGLTNREREVLGLIARGMLNKEVAAALAISIRTVEAHRESIMRKLDTRTPAGLTRAAIDAGLLGDGEGRQG